MIGSAHSGGFTYLQLADGQGREFWIITTHCEIPKGARVEGLAVHQLPQECVDIPEEGKP